MRLTPLSKAQFAKDSRSQIVAQRDVEFMDKHPRYFNETMARDITSPHPKNNHHCIRSHITNYSCCTALSI